MRRVIVFGASSYVGSSTIRVLLDAGHEVVAVSRRPAMASIVLNDVADRVISASMDEVRKDAGDAFAVLNFAYVKETKIEEAYRINRDLIDAVVETAVNSNAERVLHASTLAVFGYDLRVRSRPESVRWHPEDPYVETKILAEHRLVREMADAGKRLAVVRLGNVIGPGAPAWVGGLAQRVLEARPVAYENRDGFSNATYVENVADYFRFLIDEPGATIDAFGIYHHLAEFSSHRWRELQMPIAKVIGVESPVAVQERTRSGRADGSTRQALRSWVREGRTGGYLRAAFGVGSRSSWIREAVARGRAPVWELARRVTVTPEDEAFLRIMSVPREFRPHVVASWQPKVSFDQARRELEEWVVAAGYALQLDGRSLGNAG